MSKRLLHFDTLRGIALFTMFSANSAALLQEPHSAFFRWYGSISGFIFVALTGFFSRTSSRDWSKTVQRSGILLGSAAFIDLFCYNMLPFLGADILYQLALLNLMVPFLNRIKSAGVLFSIALGILFISPWIRSAWGYADYPTEIALSQFDLFRTIEFTTILRHWFVDGWFPLFPWAAYFIFGMSLPEILRKFKNPMGIGFAVLALGVLTWKLYPGPMIKRIDYSEVFYPAVTGYSLVSAGVFLTLLGLILKTETFGFWKMFQDLGRCSLLIYILHLFVITYGLRTVFSTMQLEPYIVVYLGFSSFLIAIARSLNDFKTKKTIQNPILRQLLGS